MTAEIKEHLDAVVELKQEGTERFLVAFVLVDKLVGGLSFEISTRSIVELDISHLQEVEPRVAELSEDVVDFGEEGIGSEQRSPSLENRMCYLKDAVVYVDVVCCQSRNQILQQSATTLSETRTLTYINQCIPSLPEITVCNDTDSLTQLYLQCSWETDHQSDNFLLDGGDIAGLESVVSILILNITNTLSAFTAVTQSNRVIHTTQFRRIKFLKKSAPASRIFSSKSVEATICRSKRAKPGVVSADFRFTSATRVSVNARKDQTKRPAMIEYGVLPPSANSSSFCDFGSYLA